MDYGRTFQCFLAWNRSYVYCIIFGYFVEHAEGHARTAQETQVNIARRPLLASSERTEKISLAHIIVSKDSRNYADYMFDR